MSEDNQEIINERARIKEIIEEEIEEEISYKINNPDSQSRRHIRIQTNYLKGRLEHLRGKIIFKIDN